MGNPRYILNGEIRGLNARLSTGTRTAENERLPQRLPKATQMEMFPRNR